MFESIWNEVEIERRPKLTENKKTEVVIVGAGLTGLLIAYYLQEDGMNVIVLEGDRIGCGMTRNTTAKITSQHNLIYKDLIDKYGMEKAREYARYNERAIKEYERLIAHLHIDCDFERKDSYVYSVKETQSLKEEVRAARSLGIDADFTTETALPFSVKGAVKFPNQAQFHPFKFLKAIADKLEIYEETVVEKRKGEHTLEVSVSLDDEREMTYEVEADVIVLANHYPIERVEGLYAARMYQEREYVLVVKAPNALPYGMYVAAKNMGYSFRSYKDYVIIAGSNHRPGEKQEQNSIVKMEETVRHYYKDAEISYRMANQDCITLDKVPYIGHFTKNSNHVYIATGFNKWGMSHAMVSALLLTEMIGKGEDKKDSIFHPARFELKASKKELKEHLATVMNQLTLKRLEFHKESIDELEPGQGDVITKHGKKIAVYKEEDGTVNCFLARCPHLGCLLEWNQEEKSWDCPCHGSRFTKDGQLINGPANGDMKEEHL